MAKTWQNYECTFNTENTSNTLPDSKYFVAPNAMRRAAFVNAGPGRPHNQMLSGSPAICYLDERSALADALMEQGDDSQVTIMAVVGDAIHVLVNDVPAGGHTIGICHRVPANGMVTFDFTNNNGVLSHIHVGHAVKNLVHGPNAGVAGAFAELDAVAGQVGKKNNLLGQLQQTVVRRH